MRRLPDGRSPELGLAEREEPPLYETWRRRGQAMKSSDSGWLWLAYAAVFVLVIGQAAVVIVSSWLYFHWRRSWPKEAFRLNVHASSAVALMALVRR
jgi:hypothetical protein